MCSLRTRGTCRGLSRSMPMQNVAPIGGLLIVATAGESEIDFLVVFNKTELFCRFRPLIMPKSWAEDKPGVCRGPDAFFCNRALVFDTLGKRLGRLGIDVTN